MAAIPNITHLIVELNTGGAEMSLLRLLQSTAGQLQHRVICFGEPADIGERISALGVPVLWLSYRRNGRLSLRKLPGALRSARRALRDNPPDVLQGWMYYGNLLASWLAAADVRVAWNIRHSLSAHSEEKFRIRAALQVARLSALQADMLIYNSHSGQASHQHLGFRPGQQRVIANGIDTSTFSFSPRPMSEPPKIGLIGRLHAHKGVLTYLRVVRQILDQHPGKCTFCMAGGGMLADNPALQGLMRQAGVTADDIDLLGPQRDVARLLGQLDVLLLTSEQEATPNVLLEAMACGAVPLATRVGDVAAIMDDDKRLVAPGDAAAMAGKVLEVLNMDAQSRLALQQRDRQIVEGNYHVDQCMWAYVDTYHELLA